jgi:hypothetical protein
MKKWINLLRTGVITGGPWKNTGQVKEITVQDTGRTLVYRKEYLFINVETNKTEWRTIDELLYVVDKAIIHVPKT